MRRIPKDNRDDRSPMDRVQREVAEIYFDADKYEGEARAAFIRRAAGARFPA